MIQKSSLFAFSLGVAVTFLAISIGSMRAFQASPVAAESSVEQLAAANWLFVGCISLNSVCYDVFQDNAGALWVCKECGQTKNPGPNKCRRLSQYEIDHSLWCS